MKTKVIFTTRYFGTSDYVFGPSSVKQLDGNLVQILNTEKYYYLSSKDDNNEIEIIGVMHSPHGKNCKEEDYVMLVKSILDKFCTDSPDEVFLLLHAGTDIPGAEIGLYDGWSVFFRESYPSSAIRVWGIKHQDTELGGSILLQKTYKEIPTAQTILHRVKALFLAEDILKAWDEYYENPDDNLYNSLIALLKKVNELSDVVPPININDFKERADLDSKENVISWYIDYKNNEQFFL